MLLDVLINQRLGKNTLSRVSDWCSHPFGFIGELGGIGTRLRSGLLCGALFEFLVDVL